MMDAYNITFRYAGENIAKGQRTPEEVVKDWMNSPGHRKNILNPHYTMIGVGYFSGLWVQEFIGK
ncbi:Cysteine-rich secretory protein family protein [compost metagenome]